MASRPRLLASLVLFFLSLVHAQISIEEALSIYLTLNTSLTDCEQCSVCANCFSCSVPGLDTTGTPTCAAQGNDINNATSFWECACHNQPEAEQQLIGLVASSCTKNTTALTNVLVGLCISFEEDIASTTSSGPPSTATSNSTTGTLFLFMGKSDLGNQGTQTAALKPSRSRIRPPSKAFPIVRQFMATLLFTIGTMLLTLTGPQSIFLPLSIPFTAVSCSAVMTAMAWRPPFRLLG